MARRARKTPVEKYQEELEQVQASITQYESCLETLRDKETLLQQQILMEKFKEVNELLEDKELSMDDLKGLIEGAAEKPVRIA